MIPRTILAGLSRLRRRERLVALAWGVARWVAVVLTLLLLCGFVDWLIDRDRDTPWAVRYLLFGLQALVAAAAGFWFILWPQLRRLHDDELALWVESKHPDLVQRLISAVQLNRQGADTRGMSPELIALVTREAERHAQTLPFAAVADHARLNRAAAVALPALLLVALPLLLAPQLSTALLARQALLDVEIPHRVSLEPRMAEVFPSGEKVKLRYHVTGVEPDERLFGEASVRPEGQPTDRYLLEYVETTPTGEVIYGVELPPASLDFVHSARLGDGRTRRPHTVRFVPRPVVQKQQAWVLLPDYCGTRPDGGRYEVPQGRGDVVGIAGSSARIVVEVSQPVAFAELQLLGPENFDPKRPGSEQGPERVTRVVAMKPLGDGRRAEATFDLRPEESGYRVVVANEHKFTNVPPPRRTVRVVPEEAPQVALLRDSFGTDADSNIEGIPVPLGGPIRIPYVAHGPYGLGQARVLYRVLRKRESGNEPAEETPWVALPLPEVKADPSAGPFDPKRGVFAAMKFDQEVPFHAVASMNPDTLGRTLGGGRYFLKTRGLIDAKGRPIEARLGDQIEYCVEVLADKNPAANRPRSRSETRVATVVTIEQFLAWSQSIADEERRLRQLDQQQRGVFGEGDEE